MFSLHLIAVVVVGACSTYASHPMTKIHTIHWNASNPLFRDAERQNVIEVNGGNHPWEYDQVNIVCPVYKTPRGLESDREQYIIYSVTREEYESCRIRQSSPKIVAVCNRPYELMYFTITFRSFTPTPGGLEFRPGQNYYFISTSSKRDLYRRSGGGCSANNMRVVFHVAQQRSQNSKSSITSTASPPNVPFPWSRSKDFRRRFSLYTVGDDSKRGSKGATAMHSAAAAAAAAAPALHAIKLVSVFAAAAVAVAITGL